MKKLLLSIPLAICIVVPVLASDFSREDILDEYGFTTEKEVWDICDFSYYMEYKDEIEEIEDSNLWYDMDEILDFYDEYYGMDIYDSDGDLIHTGNSNVYSNFVPKKETTTVIEQETQPEKNTKAKDVLSKAFEYTCKGIVLITFGFMIYCFLKRN